MCGATEAAMSENVILRVEQRELSTHTKEGE